MKRRKESGQTWGGIDFGISSFGGRTVSKQPTYVNEGPVITGSGGGGHTHQAPAIIPSSPISQGGATQEYELGNVNQQQSNIMAAESSDEEADPYAHAYDDPQGLLLLCFLRSVLSFLLQNTMWVFWCGLCLDSV